MDGITLGVGYCCDVGNVAIYKPDGTVLLSPFAFPNGGNGTPSQVLPVTGTYSIMIDPYAARTGNVTVTLSGDLSRPIIINGPSVALTFQSRQNARLTFDGTASQQVTVGLTNNTIGTVTVNLLKPDGSQLTVSTSSATSFNLASQTLPLTGTYTIDIDPSGGNTGSIVVSVTSP